MKNEQKELTYYVWTGEEFTAHLRNHAEFSIQKGDILYLTYGASVTEATRSGTGYTSQYKYGRITVAGTDASLVLDQNSRQFVEEKKEDAETLHKLIEQQKNDLAPRLEAANLSHAEKMNQRNAENKQRQQETEQRNKQNIADALHKMEDFFSGKKNKP